MPGKQTNEQGNRRKSVRGIGNGGMAQRQNRRNRSNGYFGWCQDKNPCQRNRRRGQGFEQANNDLRQ